MPQQQQQRCDRLSVVVVDSTTPDAQSLRLALCVLQQSASRGVSALVLIADGQQKHWRLVGSSLNAADGCEDSSVRVVFCPTPHTAQ